MTVYRQNTNTEKMYVCMYVCASERAKRASLENVGIFAFFQYFVGTSDTLSVQMTCLSAHMYRQISKCTDKTPKGIIGGGGNAPPPPATLMNEPLFESS